MFCPDNGRSIHYQFIQYLLTTLSCIASVLIYNGTAVDDMLACLVFASISVVWIEGNFS